MTIAMLSSEINPLVKTGGLADVVYSLSRELVIKGEKVYCFLPYYEVVHTKEQDRGLKKAGVVNVSVGWREHEAHLFTKEIEGITYCLIGNWYYFARPQVYGYGDDGERFAFFSLACVEAMKFLKVKPNIIHIHDWQVGMVPAIIKYGEGDYKNFAKTKFVMTIHNPAFKGILDAIALPDIYKLPETLYDSGICRFGDKVSTLKTGIMLADKVTTVSPTHREELLDPNFGHGLEAILELRRADFTGIVNGVDTAEFNPADDRLIPFNYDVTSFKEGKEKVRAAVLSSFGLRDTGGPIFGLVSRLTYQKGCDLILHTIREALSRGAMFLLVGSGEYEAEQGFEALAHEYPEQVGVFIGYNNTRAHLVYAASDFFLMPSLFEPCGIGQMIALRYGALPVARDTGGLHDTIVDYHDDNASSATGILFRDYDDDGMRYGLWKAEGLYYRKADFRACQENAMNVDNSWASSTALYLGLYKSIAK